MVEEFILPLVFAAGLAVGFSAAIMALPDRVKEVLITLPCEHDESLPERGIGHVHDFHIQGKEKGLITYRCSNITCTEKRVSKKVLTDA